MDIFGIVSEELQKRGSGSPGEKELPVILAIDGRCGSGKTTLAGMIAQRYRAEVIHMDDFSCRRIRGRRSGWQSRAVMWTGSGSGGK